MVWSSGELDAAITDRVSALVLDDDGKADIDGILNSLAETEFAQDGLRAILADPNHLDDWRVGEAIAEAYLSDHCACEFPWPDGRDERKSGSSLPGADLVGFRTDDDGDALAFGEVKTSTEQQYPPGAVYGRTGLKQQLEDLRDREHIRDDLLKYLCHRAKNANWKARFIEASRRYLQDKSDVHLFGFLVRDVQPNEDDLRVRVTKLAENKPVSTNVELYALYLPNGRIDGIGASILAQRTEATE
ncbi:MAG: hypothetical protein AAFQ21_00425 [Pseudomonadota bacterium]